ncbi:Non-heme 11 kDa protein of cytochrome bc1 complex [Microstroma glucosiphilum]|uniref:Cytochrome b-c1 complex subunit 6, mitochondrial n=1 Tax=Pseudomicrostroma glucosiphilum TaxID=1684307 RepID=A0A316UE91_9BASI|nr:Non-heme 11 kDa protein of cytochrome bc1 complex [Pseudomicrostroma glucosiphilum]PWN23536.1 Non-heme 11 kDa protein of cytochrome bc1 complex [Pseudomicrostroma glucosiphilum]
MSSVTSFFSSMLPALHADDEGESEEGEASEGGEESEGGEGESGGDEESSEGGEGEEEESGGDDEEEEEEEEEDLMPGIYEECEKSKQCAPAKHHFDECTNRVNEGNGFKGEDCMEEFFHLAHCASDCTAPKIFSKLV